MSARLMLSLCFLLGACATDPKSAAPDAEETDKAEDGSGVAVDTGPGATDDPPASAAQFVEPGAGCTLEEQGDIGHDGVVDWTHSITYSSVAAGSSRLILSQSYTHINGDSLTGTGSFDSFGNLLLEEQVSNIGGVESGYRFAFERDVDGNTTAYQHSDWVEGAWVVYSEGTYTPIDGDFQLGYDLLWTRDGRDAHTRVEHSRTGDRRDATVYYEMNGETKSAMQTIAYDYGDDELIDLITLNLGDGSGSDPEDRLALTWEFGYNGDGVRTSEVVTNHQGREPVVGTHILYDDQGRNTYWMVFTDFLNEERTETHTWEAELDRRTQSVFTHNVDPAGNYTDSLSYEGDWPWTETAVRVYDDASLDLDAVVQRSWSCP